jgi:DNA-directed RNA polymerase subunit F
MFLATDIKASLKQSDTRTFIERCLNIITSGIIKTTNTSLSSEADALYYDVQFNSILPSDLTETITNVTNAVNSKTMSRRTAIKLIDVAENIDDELNLINSESPTPEPTNPVQ